VTRAASTVAASVHGAAAGSVLSWDSQHMLPSTL
jgi:hypothetical protein